MKTYGGDYGVKTRAGRSAEVIRGVLLDEFMVVIQRARCFGEHGGATGRRPPGARSCLEFRAAQPGAATQVEHVQIVTPDFGF